MTWQRVGLGTMLITFLLVLWPTSALACSGPGLTDEDRLAVSDVIVGGRVTYWEVISASADTEAYRFVPIRITIEVDRVFKGDVPKHIYLVDTRSVYIDGHSNRLAWPSGTCSPFEDVPTGTYVIMGLTKNGNVYESNAFMFFFRAGLRGESYEDALVRLAPFLGPGTLPAAGASRGMAAPLLMMSGAMLLVVAILVRQRNYMRDHR